MTRRLAATFAGVVVGIAVQRFAQKEEWTLVYAPAAAAMLLIVLSVNAWPSMRVNPRVITVIVALAGVISAMIGLVEWRVKA